MRFLFSVLLMVVLLPVAVQAQDDDRGFLTEFLEENLSDAGRDIRIIGFEGALSSTATIEELTIADDDGIWLTLRGAELDWSRSALLRGRLEVETLSAEEIILPRLPAASESAPAPEATEFALPELPVSVNIGELKADRVELGAPVIGRDAVVKVDGNMSLEGGEGAAELTVERIDDEKGLLDLTVNYSNATTELALKLGLSEGPGGIAATLLNLPGSPAIDLAVAGDGPIDDYTADLTLSTEGEVRLRGQVALSAMPPTEGANEDTAQTASKYFRVNVGGDIAPLFAPDYREFFGRDIRLVARGNIPTEGGAVLERIALRAQSVELEGNGVFGPGGWPERMSLAAEIRREDGAPVLLPTSGDPTEVKRLSLELEHDRAEGDGWAAKLDVAGFSQRDIKVQQAQLTGTGTITNGADNSLGGVDGTLIYSASGVVPTDPALAKALGTDIAGQAVFEWKEDAPFEIRSATLESGDLAAETTATIAGLGEGFGIAGRLTARAGDLSRLSDLAGQNLRGAAELDIAGQVTPLGGGFDLTLSANTTNLALGIAEVDRLLAGAGEVILAAKRDTEGLTVRELTVATPELRGEASGALSSSDGGLTFMARLRDTARFVPGLSGPLTVSGDAAQTDTGDWQIGVAADGPAATRATVKGRVASDAGTAQLDISGTAPLALANPIIRPRNLAGLARFDLALNGPLALSSLSGNVTANEGRLSAPTLGFALTNIGANVRIANSRATVDVSSELSSGGRITLSGPIGLTPPYRGTLRAVAQNLNLVEPDLYETRVDGELSVDGPLTGGARIEGAFDLRETELKVPETGFGADGSLPDLSHVNEPSDVRATRRRAGLIKAAQGGSASSGPAYPVDLLIRAPSRIFLRGRGLDAELGGQLRLRGTTNNLIPTGRFELVRGRLDILGKRLTLDEGFAQLQGNFTPFIRLVAATDAGDVDVRIVVEGEASDPDIRFLSEPELPQDEVLSRLLFGRAISEISPLQAAQLASAVATLAGRGGVGIIGQLRENFGLDDFDITTDEDGTAGLRAGKYLSENVYTDVTIGSDGTSEINLNLDVSPSVTVRGSVGTDGDTGVGVFFERDY